MSEGSDTQKRQTMYSCSPSALKQFIQTKHEAPCTSANCKAERGHYNEAFSKLARAFTQIHELAEPADRTVAQAVASVQRITQEFDVPLKLPVRNSKTDQDTKNALREMAEKIRKTYGLETRPVGARVPSRKRPQAGVKDPPMQSSAAGPSHSPPDDDDLVVINDDDDGPRAPPPARSTFAPFVKTVPPQSTSFTSSTTPAKACSSGKREVSPMSSISGGSSPPSLGSEQDDMDVEVVDVPPPPVVPLNQAQRGIGGSMSLHTLGPNARRIYATTDVLDKLRRCAAHPLDFPPSEARRCPLSLHTIIAETTVLGPKLYQVALTFDGLKTSQKIALHYYLKSVVDSSENAQWQLHDELGPCIDGKPRTLFELMFDHVETGEIVMFSCRVVHNGLMGPFSVPFAVSLSRPANGINSIVKVRAPQWMVLPTPEVIELE